MFNFLKKHKNQDLVSEHFNDFQESFTPIQKKAIMASLMLIANSDREFHITEKEFFAQIALLIGYRLRKLEDMIDDFMTMNKVEMFSVLKSLDKSLKDWYIITVFGMIHADGKALESEFQYASVFFNQMDISWEYCEKVIEKATLFAQIFE